MWPPRLAEPPQQRAVARLEEDQPDFAGALFLSRRYTAGKLSRPLPLPDVDDDGGPADVAGGVQGQVRERRDERNGKIVDAEVPEILQRADRVRLARPRQSRDHDERRRLPGELRRRLRAAFRSSRPLPRCGAAPA